jgi:hypothetical protein
MNKIIIYFLVTVAVIAMEKDTDAKYKDLSSQLDDAIVMMRLESDQVSGVVNKLKLYQQQRWDLIQLAKDEKTTRAEYCEVSMELEDELEKVWQQREQYLNCMDPLELGTEINNLDPRIRQKFLDLKSHIDGCFVHELIKIEQNKPKKIRPAQTKPKDADKGHQAQKKENRYLAFLQKMYTALLNQAQAFDISNEPFL